MEVDSKQISKTDVLNQCEGLKFVDKVKKITLIAKQLNEADTHKLIEDLRKHPDPQPPEVEVEEGFVEVLPSQRKNVAKYHTEDHIALKLAVVKKDKAVIRDELFSPSVFFKKLACKESVHFALEDKDLEFAILNGSPKVRDELLHQCVRYQKVDLLDKLFPQFKMFPEGRKITGKFFHGCSGKLVDDNLRDMMSTYPRDYMNWKMIARFHPAVLLKHIRNDLTGSSYRLGVWSQWEQRFTTKVWEQLFYKAHYTKEVFNLMKTMPYFDYSVMRFPSIFSTFFKHFFHQEPHQIMDIFISNWGTHSNSVYSALGSFWHQILSYNWKKLVGMQKMCDLISQMMKYHFDVYYYESQSLINSFDTLVRDCTADETMVLFNLIVTPIIKYNEKKEQKNKNSDHANQIFQLYRAASLKLSQLLQMKQHRFTATDYILHKTTEDTQKLLKSTAAFTKLTFSFKMSAANIIEYLANFKDNFMGCLIPEQWKDLYAIAIEAAQENNKFPAIHPEVLRFMSGAILSLTECVTSIDTLGKSIQERKTAKKLLEHEEDEMKKLVIVQQSAVNVKKSMIDIFLKTFEANPLESYKTFLNIVSTLDTTTRVEFFKFMKESHIRHLALHETSGLLDVFSHIPLENLNSWVTLLLADKQVTERTKDLLKGYQNLEDPSTRNKMQKGCDSNNESERKTSIAQLLESSRRISTPVHVVRTLKFLQKKILNEKVEIRTQVLGDLTMPENLKMYFGLVDNKEVFDLWFTLLNDALEAQDLDENDPSNRTAETIPSHTVLSKFTSVSHRAMTFGAANLTSEFGLQTFDFGIELQWRMWVFRKGERDAAEEFKVVFPSAMKSETPSLSQFINRTKKGKKKSQIRNHFANLKKRLNFIQQLVLVRNPAIPLGKERQFVDVFLKSIESRVSLKNPTWAEKLHFYASPLFSVLGISWTGVEKMIEIQMQLLQESKKDVAADHEGLLLIESSSPAIVSFEPLMSAFGPFWTQIPVFKQYLEFLLKSRQAGAVVSRFVYMTEGDALKTKQRKMARDKTVTELLKVSKSAIHLKMVHRHLINHRQDLLDEFIDARQSFRGVFYVEPAERPLFKVTAEPPKVAAPVKRGRAKKTPTVRTPKVAFITRSMAEVIKEETTKEQKLKQDIESGQIVDHKDFFIFDECFRLERMSLSQVEKHAKQLLNAAFNFDRSVPDRTKLMQRWTLLPTTGFIDIVQLLELYAKDKKKVPVNLEEALLKGLMYNDEPLAPLRYLLSPKFLSSNRARIAGPAIIAAVPWLRVGSATKLIKYTLTGERRHALKVTAYKSVIRVLASQPSDAHIQMILHEWERKELHRDVRIAIMQVAFRFLGYDEAKATLAWKILSSTLNFDNMEILAALLGAVPHGKAVKAAKGSRSLSFDENLFLKPRILDQWKSMASFEVPAQYGKQFAEEIVLVLADLTLNKTPTEAAKNSDIIFLALGSLREWISYLNKDSAIDVLIKFMNNTKDELLWSEKKDYVEMFDRRWKRLASDASFLMEINTTILTNLANYQDTCVSVVKTWVELIQVFKPELRTVVPVIVGLIKTWDSYVTAAADSTYRDTPFQKPLQSVPYLWQVWASRKTRELCWISAPQHVFDECYPFIAKLLENYAAKPDAYNFVKGLIQQFLGSNGYNYAHSSVPLCRAMIDFKFENKTLKDFSAPEQDLIYCTTFSFASSDYRNREYMDNLFEFSLSHVMKTELSPNFYLYENFAYTFWFEIVLKHIRARAGKPLSRICESMIDSLMRPHNRHSNPDLDIVWPVILYYVEKNAAKNVNVISGVCSLLDSICNSDQPSESDKLSLYSKNFAKFVEVSKSDERYSKTSVALLKTVLTWIKNFAYRAVAWMKDSKLATIVKEITEDFKKHILPWALLQVTLHSDENTMDLLFQLSTTVFQLYTQNLDYQKATDNQIEQILPWLELLKKGPIPQQTTSGKDAVVKDFKAIHIYTHNSKLLMLMLLVHVGHLTVTPHQVGKDYKMMWRPSFVKLLNEMCVDKDEQLQRLAFPVQIEYRGNRYVAQSALQYRQ